MLKSLASIVMLVGMVATGCKHNTENSETEITTVDSAKATATYAVVIGMENSRFAGSCPGAALDADRMYEVIKAEAKHTVLLKDQSATKAKVAAAIAEGIEKSGDGLFILYYSGHGGSEPFADTGIEESDGRDEFLCLYDTYMRDNEIWRLISKSKGRVFLCFDACHSQTMFAVPCVRMAPPLGFDHKLTGSAKFSMLCWSGCPDANYSYGAATGGQLTNTLLKFYHPGVTYEQLWKYIKNDRNLQYYENPQSTVIGDGFDDRVFLK